MSSSSDADLGAYIDRSLSIQGASSGLLAGKTVAIKDLFDVQGHRTGFGHPLWRQTHPAAASTAPAVQQLLDAGASVKGRTHMDELAYSLNGENHHYGTPANPAAPGRVPGGSSSGSAVAVAAGHVDIGLGSDTGGSVRIPASYCGVYGIRPSHGRVSLEGARPLAPSFDTVGWFTRSASLLRDVGSALLPQSTSTHHAGADNQQQLSRWVLATDVWRLAEPAAAAALLGIISPLCKDAQHGQGSNAVHASAQPATSNPSSDLSSTLDALCTRMLLGRPVVKQQVAAGNVALEGAGLDKLPSWLDVFRICQAGEIWQQHGGWITEHKPEFGPGIKERFAMASSITQEEWAHARGQRELICSVVGQLLGSDGVLLLPTAPGPAPRVGTPGPALDEWRKRMISLTCIAGLTGSPQVSLPAARVDGLPVGLSLLGPVGSDEKLLQLAEQLAHEMQHAADNASA